MFVFKAAVVGAGTMGGQIAQTIAAAGIPVVLKDVSQDFVDAGLTEARNVTAGQMARLVKKERLTQEEADAQVEEVVGRITGTTGYEGFGDVDFVIEAVPERMEIKQAVFGELDAVTPGHAILASNTSSLSITEIGDATLRPEKVCGFHYFYPASVLPLVEIVEGDDTEADTISAAVNFAQAIRKQPIVCEEVPGFVVNRILNRGVSEIWRAQEEQGSRSRRSTRASAAANVAPMGPFFLIDLLGLDTVFHVAEHLHESYGDRFYVPKGMRKLVEDGKLGAKTGGEGFYKDGEPQPPRRRRPDREDLAELLHAGGAARGVPRARGGRLHHARDRPRADGRRRHGPAPRACCRRSGRPTSTGLDVVLEKIEQAEEEHGERFAPPTILRRLVAQGRLGLKAGQGFYAYPQPDEGDQADTVKLETRGGVAIAWLANLPMNAISPQRDPRPRHGLGAGQGRRRDPRAWSIASSVAAASSRRAPTSRRSRRWTRPAGRELIDDGHALLREFGTSERRDDRRGQRASPSAAAASWRWPATCASPPSRRSSASPRSSSGSSPASAAPSGCRGSWATHKALEMNLTGDAITRRGGLRVRAGQPRRARPRAVRHRARLGAQARRPGAGRRGADQAGLRTRATSTRASRPRSRASRRRSSPRTRKEGIGAFLGKRTPKCTGK